MNPSESGRLGKFRPSVHHTKQDELVVYWSEEPDYKRPIDDKGTIVLLPSVKDATVITGVRVPSFTARYVQVAVPPEPPPPRPDFSLDELVDRFRPYVYYDVEKQTAVIRWAAGAVIREDNRDGTHPFTLLRSASTKQIVGVVLTEATRWFRWR